jgi:hypothetical protein
MFVKQKRGQIPSQIFVYILALIIVAMILLFGYKAISNMQKRGEQVVLIQFKTQLKNDVERLSSDYGSVRIGKYKLPSGFDEICFVDLKNVNPSDIMNHPIIKDSVESGVKENIFLLGKSNFDSIYVEDLELSSYPYFSCISSKIGSVELRIEGKGNAAVIKTPPSQKYCQNAQDGGLCDGLDIVFGSGYKSDCCKEYGLCC